MRGGAPPDLLFAESVCPAVAANTVTAFQVLVAAPPAGQRVRLWIVGTYLNATLPAAPANWFADFIFNAPASRFARVSGSGFSQQEWTFPGGYADRNGDARPVDVRFMANAANPALTAVAYYTIEDV